MVHFGGFQVGQSYKVTVQVCNVSHVSQRLQYMPLSTSHFHFTAERKGLIAPGMSEEVVAPLSHQPHTKATNLLIVIVIVVILIITFFLLLLLLLIIMMFLVMLIAMLMPWIALWQVTIEFRAAEWKYYYGCLRVHGQGCKLIIPLHAYPVLNEITLPKKVDFGTCALQEGAVIHLSVNYLSIMHSTSSRHPMSTMSTMGTMG